MDLSIEVTNHLIKMEQKKEGVYVGAEKLNL